MIFLVEFSRITTCEGIIDQIDRSPNSFAERAILETLKGSKYSRDDYDLINPIFGTYINGRAMRQSQIKLDRDVNLQSEMIEYIMSKCLDNFERSLILIDCAQVHILSNLTPPVTYFFSLLTLCLGKSSIILQMITERQLLYHIVRRCPLMSSMINIDSLRLTTLTTCT